MFTLDKLDPTQFEEFCYDLLTALGFINVNWRKGTGLKSSPSDFGRDIECQYKRVDVDDQMRLEQWFVECKHYRKGVPATELRSALTWAESERVDTLLFIVSNFLSNPAKEFLKRYEIENKSRFKVKIWEIKDLEQLTAGKALLLRKYGLIGDFPFLTVIHPAHALYMRNLPFNTLDYLFSVLDDVEPQQERDGVLSWISHALVKAKIEKHHTSVVFGQSVTVPVLDWRSVTYDVFKKRCYELARYLEEPLLVFLIVNWVLQGQLAIGDTTSIEEFIQKRQNDLEFTRGEFRKHAVFTEEDEDACSDIEARLQETIDNARENTHKQYDLYVSFCEKVVAPLLQERYFERT